jgi:uroporphyrinogen-III decarboxylase
MMGLWEEGITNYMFAEGGYNSRLETIAQLPKGSSAWIFDQTDMRRAKECLEGNAMIAGNVPASVMQTGSPEKVREVCGELVDLFSGSAGYILGLGCGIETSTDEKVRIFLDSVKK